MAKRIWRVMLCGSNFKGPNQIGMAPLRIQVILNTIPKTLERNSGDT